MRLAVAAVIWITLVAPARAEDPAPEPAPAEDAPVVVEVAAEALAPQSQYVPAASETPALVFAGYLDFGLAKAQGDGTSWAPREERVPIDYVADTFATAVNSRGDVASIASRGLFTNGFLPRSLDLGGHWSPFISTASLDVRYAPEGSKTTAFLRVQLLPRLTPAQLNDDRVLLQQAFVKWTPLESQEFTITIGRFDPVFGIEYLETEAPLRTGITPSLIARYTTGWQLGAKAFFRFQIPDAWSAFSVNAAATNNSSLVEALQPSAVSLTGVPMLQARVGYELNHPSAQLKIGASYERGPRQDQGRSDVGHLQQGLDARLNWGWVSASAEWVHVDMREGGSDKAGAGRLVSPFRVDGYTLFAGLAIPAGLDWLRKATPYARYDRRTGGFIGFSPIDTDRWTAGLRLDPAEGVIVKAEYLWNGELSGAANVDNDVFTSSFAYVF